MQQTLDAAIKEFLAALENELRKSPNTVKTYRTALTAPHGFREAVRASAPTMPTTDQLTVEHVMLWARQLKQHRIAASTAETYLIALNRFYRFATRQGWRKLEPREQERLADFLRESRERRAPLPKALPASAFNALIETARLGLILLLPVIMLGDAISKLVCAPQTDPKN